MPRKVLPKELENIVERHEKNPIISIKDVPFACEFIFNAGAIKLDGKYVLLVRVEDTQGTSNLTLASSDNGVDFTVPKSYAFSPSQKEPCEKFGVEDPRITRIGKKLYFPYTAHSSQGPAVGLAVTTNFKDIKRLGIILAPADKDAVLLPEKIKDEYVLYHRPSASKSIWISYSKDLVYWGRNKCVMEPEPGSWDSEKVGEGAVPIKTEDGWLHIYHGISGGIYRLGVALFDLEHPSRLIRRSKSYILAPQRDYERQGGVNNVVFTCGAIVEDNKDVKLYYGAADTCICLATTTLEKLVKFAKEY
jgi:beta-1,4-mannooligosaccharide/beta-1,4-mannosyl-N-acetylglucosamine phosphorylase